jgi:hypothetical protein
MGRGVLILLIVLAVLLGVGFLALMWFDMRHGAIHPPVALVGAPSRIQYRT